MNEENKEETVNKSINIETQPTEQQKKRTSFSCPKCGSSNINVQVVTNVMTKRRGCIGWALWILLAMCTFGLILIIPLLTNSKTKSKTHNEAICQNCGHSWKVKK